MTIGDHNLEVQKHKRVILFCSHANISQFLRCRDYWSLGSAGFSSYLINANLNHSAGYFIRFSYGVMHVKSDSLLGRFVMQNVALIGSHLSWQLTSLPCQQSCVKSPVCGGINVEHDVK